MKQIDNRLFIMKDYLDKHQFDKYEVADYLDVSERHLTRLLKQWEAEKWIIYIRGQGRGNRSEIYFDEHLEAHCVNRVLGNLAESSRQDIVEVLSLPIAAVYKNIIKRTVDHVLIRPQQKREKKLVRYSKRIPSRDEEFYLHNPHYLELNFNTGSRLYDMDKQGEIQKSLIRKDEWEGSSLILYLRKDVHFYNGHVLFAADVVQCLRDAFNSGAMQKYSSLIQDISVVSPFKVRIDMTHKNDWIKYVLSSVKTTIYKKFNGEILTTGPFYVDNACDDTVTLKRNDYYYSETGDIGLFEITSDRQYYFSMIKDHTIKNIYYSNCTDSIMINPYKDDLTHEARQLLLKYAVEFMDRVLPESTEFESRLISMYDDFDVGPACPDNVFTRPLKFFYHLDDKPAEYLIAFLIGKGVPIIGFEFDRSNDNKISRYEGDIMFLSEQNSHILGFYNLLESSTFGTWFGHLEKTKDYIASLMTEPLENWKLIEEKYTDWLYESAYFIHLSSKAERLTLPAEYHNIMANIYGAIDFNAIVSTKTDNTVQ